MRIAWLTDIHLNFLEPPGVDRFISKIKAKNVDVVIITGDIGESGDFGEHLDKMARDLAKPVMFTLGNHDFYGSSFRKVKERARQLNEKINDLSSNSPYFLNALICSCHSTSVHP